MAVAPTAFRYVRIVSITLLLLARAPGQTSATAPPQSVEDALHQMSDQAAVIFAGQVIAVRRNSEEVPVSGAVEVEFRVDRAIRGCTAGVPYLLHEWAGLWTGDVQRYRVGERLLMFLRAPGPSGLASPIGGMDGAIPIHGTSSPLIATGSTVSQYPVADLRWIGTEVLRPISYATTPLLPSAFASSTLKATAGSMRNADLPATIVNKESASSIPSQQASGDAVIEMITSWQKAQNAVH